MATALQTQLAKHAVNATNSLDLKAQRRAHAQSLLFEPKVAGSQDFHTLYEICLPGFQSLCSLDERFLKYARTLFSEQSRDQDRSQLTAGQNADLDTLIEDFLQLVAGRILLAPASQAIEWLVRRFRIHELNTQAMLLAFLSYHRHPVFLTLLTITPATLPLPFRFLDLFRQAKQNPPYESILNSAINIPALLTALNTFTITCCKKGYSHSQLVDFWSVLINQVIARQLDAAAKGRTEARRQKEEDVMIRIVPVLNQGLGLGRTAARDGCYMIMMVLATKMQLPDRTLSVFMDAVVDTQGLQLNHNDFTTLAVLSRYREELKLPKKTLKAVVRNKDLVHELRTLMQKYEADRFILSVALSILDRLGKPDAAQSVDILGQILEDRPLNQESTRRVTTALVETTNAYASESTADAEVHDRLAKIILRLATSESAGEMTQAAIHGDVSDDEGQAISEKHTNAVQKSKMTFEDDLSSLSDFAKERSFLRDQTTPGLAPLMNTCVRAGSRPDRWQQIHKIMISEGDSSSEERFLTLLARFWCGTFPASSRKQALLLAKQVLLEGNGSVNTRQYFVLPYVLVALADHSQIVRGAAADVLSVIDGSASQGVDSSHSNGKQRDLYSQERFPELIFSLSPEDTSAFVLFLKQHLEECKLDASYVAKLIHASLHDGRVGGSHVKVLRDHGKEAILSFISLHIILTPLLRARSQLLKFLHGVGKIKNKSKTSLMLPLVREAAHIDAEELKTRCKWESLDAEEYAADVIATISATNKDGLKTLRHIIEDEGQEYSVIFRQMAVKRVKSIWHSMKIEGQQRTVSTLLKIVWHASLSTEGEDLGALAAETLRSLSLSPEILCHMLDTLPSLIDDGVVLTSPTKRRRTENGHVENREENVSPAAIQKLRQWTFVLELVDSADGRGDFNLISALSNLLNDMHACTTSVGGQLYYVLSQLLECCNGAVTDISRTKAKINPNIIPVDTVIDIFQMTKNAQIQRTSLLFISTLARAFPDIIIHHIMPVFTKMGQSVLQSADEYSVYITNLAVASIIPPLLASFDKQKGGAQEGTVRLLLSFVAAFEHIPLERRVPLFTSLVLQLGSERALHLLILLFVSKFGRDKLAEDFIVELISLYSPKEQFLAVDGAAKIAVNAISEFPAPLTGQILQASDRTACAALILQVVVAVTRILQDQSLIRKAAQAMSSDGDSIRALYGELSSSILKLSNAASVDLNRKLPDACESLTDAALCLLPVHDSIVGLETLLLQEDNGVIRQTLKSIEQRIRRIGTGDTISQAACVNLLPVLAELLLVKEDGHLLQTCVVAVDGIIERFGKKNLNKSLVALKAISVPKFLSGDDAQATEISILCIATAAQVLGESVISILPQTILLVLNTMSRSLQEPRGVSVINAAYTLFSAVLDSMPWVLSKSDVETLLRHSATAASSPSLSHGTLDSRTSALELLARRVETRECLEALSSTWTDVIRTGIHAGISKAGRDARSRSDNAISHAVGANEALLQHLHVARTIIGASSKATVVRQSQVMMRFYKQIFDLPSWSSQRQTPGLSLSNTAVEEVIAAAADNMVSMIYKLNDATFRPLFTSLVDWTGDGQASHDSTLSTARHFSLYTFLNSFFGTLKSIVTSYAGLIIEDAAEILTQEVAPAAKHDIERAYDYGLWCRVLETLRKALDNDADEYFQAPPRFGPLCEALVGQIPKVPALMKRLPLPLQDEDAHEVLEGHVIPTIVALASAADAAENAKVLNKGVLREMRSYKPEVRMSAIRCQQALVEKLGEDWLTNLPEMLPVVGEVLEDEDEDVVREARKWVVAIEGVLGESLEGMLQ